MEELTGCVIRNGRAEKVTVKMPQGKSIPITKKLVENINACTERRIRSEKSKGEKQ